MIFRILFIRNFVLILMINELNSKGIHYFLYLDFYLKLFL